MSNILLSGALGSAVLAGSMLTASSVSAHINMDGVLQGRNGNQKAAPCEGAGRSAGKVYTFEPGATITIGVDENIRHDGYFRIAFDNDGEDGFKDPVSISPVNPNRFGTGKACEGTAADRCGKSDFCNVVSATGGPTVLWDNLNPHLGSESLGKYSWTVTLPNVECTNCTLQVIQVMEDPAGGFHGPYDGKNDLYYRCVNIALKKGAGNPPGTATGPANNRGINCLAKAGGSDAGVPDAGSPTPDASTPDAGTPAKPDAGKPDAGTPPEPDAACPIDDDKLETLASLDEGGEPESSEGGCSLANGSSSTAQSAGWMLLALGGLVARRRKLKKS